MANPCVDADANPQNTVVVIEFPRYSAYHAVYNRPFVFSTKYCLHTALTTQSSTQAAKECLSTYIGTSIETRTLSVTPNGISAIRGYVALQLVGTVVEVVRMLRMEPKKRSKQFPIIVHHIVSILACVSTQYHRRLMSSACCLICVEFSTIFLNLLLFTKSEAFKPWLEKNVPWLEGLSGVGLWCVFVHAFYIVESCSRVRWHC